MKTLVFIFLLISSVVGAQELEVKQAKIIAVRQAETTLTLYKCQVLLSKDRNFKWSIDSVISLATGKKVRYHLVKVDDPGAVSPDYKSVNSFSKKDKGNYLLSFTPERSAAGELNTAKGIVICYKAKNKRKQLLVDLSGKTETVETP